MLPHCMVHIVHVPPISSSTSCPSALVAKATEQLARSVRAGICELMSIHAGTEDGTAATSIPDKANRNVNPVPLTSRPLTFFDKFISYAFPLTLFRVYHTPSSAGQRDLKLRGVQDSARQLSQIRH